MRQVIDQSDLAPDRTATPVLRVPAVAKNESDQYSTQRGLSGAEGN